MNLKEEIKDYEKWFELKPKINAGHPLKGVFIKEGQVWWCSLGANVGMEIDGKNDLFERPVLIFRVFNRNHLFVLPIGSHSTGERYSVGLNSDGSKIVGFVLLSQIRTISSLRLLKFITTVSPVDFDNIRSVFIRLL